MCRAYKSVDPNNVGIFAGKKGWKEILRDFTQETTLHGIRYITLETKYILRRYIIE